MPLNINLPTTGLFPGGPEHVEGHLASNDAVNRTAGVVDGLDARTGRLERGAVATVSVNYSPSIILDARQGSLFRLVASGNVNLVAIIEPTNGQQVTLRVFAAGADRSITAFGRTDTITVGKWWTGRFFYDQPTDSWTRDLASTPAEIGAQPADADLTGLAALPDGVPSRVGGVWSARSSSQLRTDLGLAPVAVSGAYADLAGRPTLYTATDARTDVGAALEAGSGITIDPAAPGGKIRVSATGSGSSGGTVTVPDGSVTDASVATGAAVSLAKTVDSATSPGRLALTNAERTQLAGMTTALAGKAATSHTHAAGDLTAVGTGDQTTLFLRKDNVWAVPPGVTASGASFSTRTVSYTVGAADVGIGQIYNSTSAGTFTLPTNAAQAIAVGKSIPLLQSNTGQLSVAAAAGVTLNSRGGALKLAGRYAVAEVVKVATDEWWLYGDITT